MKNFIQPGAVISHANTAAVASGDAVLIGLMLGVAVNSYAANAAGEYAVTGVYNLPKAAGALTIGAQLYWDNAAKNLTATTTGNTAVGKCWVAAAAGATTVAVKINV